MSSDSEGLDEEHNSDTLPRRYSSEIRNSEPILSELKPTEIILSDK